MSTTACPTCGTPMRIAYRVTTGADGYARLGSARRVDARGARCRPCTLAAVDAANDPARMAAKAGARLAARDARRAHTIF